MSEIKTQMTIGPVRFSYLTVWEPKVPAKALPTTTPKYSAELRIPKSDTKTVELLKTTVKALKADWLTKTGNKVLPPGFRGLLKDGDAKNEDGEYLYEESCRGFIFFSASSLEQPGVFDKGQKPMMNKADAYSGMWGYAAINLFHYNNQGQGISAGLNHIMKTKDDTPFSARVSADEAFKNVSFDDDDLIG